MSCYYDLHIHTALSPCGDEDMTPNNIVNMSVIKGLDVIAITDHNTALNARVCFECGKREGIIVLPGIEIETLEEVHITALFDNPDAAEELDKIIYENLPKIKNRTDIFGNQTIFNESDEKIGEVQHLLSTATTLDVYTSVELVRKLGGVAIPAHIDKSSYSVISNLGFIPPGLNFSTVEVKFPERVEALRNVHNLDKYKVIHNSDAHFLWDIHEKIHCFEKSFVNGTQIIDYLR